MLEDEKTLSLSFIDNSCKHIDVNVQNIAKEFKLSQYDKVMIQGLGLCKNLDDKLFQINDSDEEVDIEKDEIASQILKSTLVNYRRTCSLSSNSKRKERKRKVFKVKKNTRRNTSNTFDEKIYKIVTDRRNNTPQEKIVKIRRRFLNGQFEFDKKRKINKIIIPMYLKSLSLTKSGQNPIKSCRFYEFVFPLDSKLYCSGSGSLKQICESIKLLKRIYRTEHNTLKQKIKYLIEEKDLALIGKNNEGIMNAYGYFCEWLKSLNNAKAKFFSDSLIQFKKHVFERTEYVNKMIDVSSMEKNSSKSNYEMRSDGKFWIKKLDSNTKKWQKKLPYICKVLKTGQETRFSEVATIALNYSMFDFLGYNPNAQNHDACFNILAIFANIDNLVLRFITDEYQLAWNVPNVAKPTQQMATNTINQGNKAKTSRSMLFHEIWVHKDYYYRRSYQVMNIF